MKENKRGVTLVELIICCGIIVMIGGACTAVLMSGHKIFNNSASSAGAQLDTDVIQTYLTSIVPRTKTVSNVTEVEAATNTTDCVLYFAGDEDDDVFTIRLNGKDTTLQSVVDFQYQMKPAGDGEDDAVKPQFCYTVTMTDGSTYTSGFVLINLNYKTCEADLCIEQSAKVRPICISVASAS